MAAGSLPAPGTKYGPCDGDCPHVDCASTRRMAAELCIYCNDPMGYGASFFMLEGSKFAHEWCAYEAWEKEREGRRS